VIPKRTTSIALPPALADSPSTYDEAFVGKAGQHFHLRTMFGHN
jgi:hypothetical protein